MASGIWMFTTASGMIKEYRIRRKIPYTTRGGRYSYYGKKTANSYIVCHLKIQTSLNQKSAEISLAGQGKLHLKTVAFLLAVPGYVVFGLALLGCGAFLLALVGCVGCARRMEWLQELGGEDGLGTLLTHILELCSYTAKRLVHQLVC